MALFLLALLAGCEARQGEHADTAQTRRVTDPTGRQVALPAEIRHIGCLTGASYEKAFLVGAGDQVVVRAATYPPWMERTNPAVRRIPVIRDSHNPNIEELLRLKPDVLFSWDAPGLTRKLEQNGLAVVSPQPTRAHLESEQDFIALFKAEVAVYGRVLGPDAARRAAAWSAYFDRTVDLVRRRTADLKPAQRPATYYVRGPDALTTHGAAQNISWFGAMAGADMLVRRSDVRGIAAISMEQIVRWDPEVIFVGRQYSPDLVLQDPRWRQIRAVRTHRVYVIPDGVFYWDASSEGALLLLYLAKTLHPDRFADIDMAREVRNYYRDFYRYPLTGQEAERLLHGLDPEGRRHNLMNN